MRHRSARPRHGIIAALTLALLAPPGATAAPMSDPDWPCQSIRVSQLSLPSVWDGPSAEPYLAHWEEDAEVAALVREVTPRRVPLADGQAAIRAFAASLAAQRRERLLALVAGLFETLDQERRLVLAGLDRFGRRQRELVATIHDDMARLRTAPPEARAPLSDQLGWETRLFEARRQSAAAACNVPTVIEQRLFQLVRAARQAMD
jgi:hypothetical protein